MSVFVQPQNEASLTAYRAVTGFEFYESARHLSGLWEFGLNTMHPMLLLELDCAIEQAHGQLNDGRFAKTDRTHSLTIMGRASRLTGCATGTGVHRVFFVALTCTAAYHFPEYALIDLATRPNLKDGSLDGMCRKVHSAVRAGEDLLVESLCCEMTGLLLDRYSTGPARYLPRRIVLSRGQLIRVLEQMEDVVFKADESPARISVHSLAASVQLSSHYFLTAFKSALGVTPHQYILRKRFRRARHLLATTRLPILVVGESCGFRNQSYFAAGFKSATGLSPGCYRKAIQRASERLLS